MADWSALVQGFQQGSDFTQRYRQNKQMEKARDYALEGAEYDMQSRRANRRALPPGTEDLAAADPSSMADWGGQLQDPFAMKLAGWFKKKFGKGKGKQAALDLGGGEIAPTDSVAAISPAGGDPSLQTYALNEEEPLEEGQAYADGGEVEEMKRRAAENRARTSARGASTTETVSGADRTAKAAEAAVKGGKQGLLRRAANSKLGRAAGAIAAGGAIVNATDEDYDDRANKRFPYLSSTTEQAKEGGFKEAAKFGTRRALMFASDLANNLSGGALGKYMQDYEGAPAGEQFADVPAEEAPPMQEEAPYTRAGAVDMGMKTMSRPTRGRVGQSAPKAETVDFSGMDIDPKEVPDMKTDDWKAYRMQLMDAARRSGNPQAVKQANDMVTSMQQDGFLNYAQQGLALMQAGNARGAMAAFRAAYQYFPNGYDVEFGIHKGKVVGFGRDEQTGKVVPGTELVMDPERVGVLIENFKNPQAFRMWTKDWRDFKEGERRYEEVTKPMAQAQADALATNSDANVVRAENAALRAQMSGAGGGAGGGATMRNAERVFRERVQMLGMEDEAMADHLASVMAQIKAKNPQTPDNSIIEGVMRSMKDGTLQQRLRAMGIGAPAAAPAGGGALPMGTPAPRAAPPGPGPGDNSYVNPAALEEANQYEP